MVVRVRSVGNITVHNITEIYGKLRQRNIGKLRVNYSNLYIFLILFGTRAMLYRVYLTTPSHTVSR